MKKMISLLLGLALALALAGCGTSGQSAPGNPPSIPPATPSPAPSPNSALSGSTAGSGAALQAENSRILIAYYSWADNAALAGDVDATASPSVLSPGNVQQLAGWIQEQTGGDLFFIRVL